MVSLAGVLLLGVSAQWLAAWARLPSILFMLAFGLIAGPISGFVDPDDLLGKLLLPGVSIAVCLVLFEGSLSLRMPELGRIAGPLRNLLSIGVVVTWACCGVAAYFLLQTSLTTSVLLGAILIVTGPTVVGPLLRHIRPVGSVGHVAKWEGIVIDPIGAVFAVLTFEAIEAWHAAGVESASLALAEGLLTTIVVGTTVGLGGAWALAYLLRRHWIADHLQSPLTLATVVAAFTVSNLIQHESGLLTVTLMGIALANLAPIQIKRIQEFKEDLSVLLISSLFILLAARLSLEDIAALGWRGPAFVAAVIFVIRPVAVFVSCIRSNLTLRERIFLAWMAPRGIVAGAMASVFALRLGETGAPLVPATFLVICGTVVVYGLTAAHLARWLGISSANPQGLLIAGAYPGARAIAHAVQNAGFRVLLVDSNWTNVMICKQEGLPAHFANVLSDEALEQLELGGLGRFLGMTSNDEVNSLAALLFSEVFGRSEVYQLAPLRTGKQGNKGTSVVKGRTLFASDVTYEVLEERFAAGHEVKTTPLTDEFNYDNYMAHYGGNALVLFVVRSPGTLSVRTNGETAPPKRNHSVISIVPPLADS